uniref:Uncharacterized protein n=1 Tax=Arundo donax TaxID=35708 RepID=A0A0A9BVZ1_ARUDO
MTETPSRRPHAPFVIERIKLGGAAKIPLDRPDWPHTSLRGLDRAAQENPGAIF